jgi:hypothetical protein
LISFGIRELEWFAAQREEEVESVCAFGKKGNCKIPRKSGEAQSKESEKEFDDDLVSRPEGTGRISS